MSQYQQQQQQQNRTVLQFLQMKRNPLKQSTKTPVHFRLLRMRWCCVVSPRDEAHIYYLRIIHKNTRIDNKKTKKGREEGGPELGLFKFFNEFEDTTRRRVGPHGAPLRVLFGCCNNTLNVEVMARPLSPTRSKFRARPGRSYPSPSTPRPVLPSHIERCMKISADSSRILLQP